jgi:tetratricopeptide (TPR) repeat protein
MANDSYVKIWEEDCVLPTYPVLPPEKSPLFIEKRAYQGSTGKVYPLPVSEKISDTKEDVSYHAVWLENEYLKVMVLPEIGGRIQRAYDKTNGYDFVYYNHVIKPALVGLTGPWISGGIEFNWPQHHRPSTYSPVDYTVSENPDGSCTVHVSEIDKMYGTKGMASITLYPGKAYIEIKGQVYNHTDLPQTFLWWANPAVPVNDHTYSVFPPDVNAVMDHGRRAVSTFPIATGEYYKCDYSAGVDISRYKNVKVPTSYMAAHSDFDFVGNYDEGVEAGLLHVADHHISPGKKQWTWGNGDFGRTWDRNLTDEDGPYIELMTGVYTDNQPDFTWLKPQEEKTFVQYFMPYKGVGRVGNATKDGMLSLSDGPDNTMLLKVYTTALYKDASIIITEKNGSDKNAVCSGGTCSNGSGSSAPGKVLFEACADLSPEKCYTAVIPALSDKSNCRIVVSCGRKEIVTYSEYEKTLEPVPEPAEAMKSPEEMKSLEELYLAATHLEQYRHATFEPADYYLEGLKRDATDIRLNNGYGLLLYKRGQIKESIPYFQAAIKKQTWKNPNPYLGECYFNLGLALETDGQDDKAYDAFFKSTWSAETQGPGFYWLSCLALRKGDTENALAFVDKALICGWHNMKARTLKAAILRIQRQDNEKAPAAEFLKESLRIDPLYMGCLYEQALPGSISNAADTPFDEHLLDDWKSMMRCEAHNYLELALDYMKAGLYTDALQILSCCTDGNPLCQYYKGYICSRLGRDDAEDFLRLGEESTPDYCFPNRIEEIRILEYAIATLDAAPMAHYYLGNLLYDKKQYEAAVSHWEMSVQQKPDLAMTCRNLAIAYYNKQKDSQRAMDAIEKACQLEPTYPRFWLEYDQLAARINVPNDKRLEVMESHMDVTKDRDDLYLRYITLLNCTGQYEKALAALKDHHFHPWEGGEGKVSTQYRYALIHLAVGKLADKEPEEALRLLTASLTYPDNLGEGKLPNVPDNEAYYYMGLACRMAENEKAAKEYLCLAASGPTEPGSVLYYNDQPSDFIFYQGLAHMELGEAAAAKKSFHQLITYGEKHLFDHAAYDFFAVSLPEIEVYQDDLQLRSTQYCNYLRALGALGLGEKGKAQKLLTEILQKQADYQGALAHMKMCR